VDATPPPLGATSQLFVLKRLSFKGPSGNQDHDDRQAAIREMDLLGGRLFLPLGATPLFIKKIRSVYRPANTSIAHSQLFFFASAIFSLAIFENKETYLRKLNLHQK